MSGAWHAAYTFKLDQLYAIQEIQEYTHSGMYLSAHESKSLMEL